MTPHDLPPAAQTHPTHPARRRPLNRWRFRAMGSVIVGVLMVGVVLATDYFTRINVTFDVNGTPYHLRTHAHTVQAALDAAGIHLTPPDTVWPLPQTELETAHAITVRQAHEVALVWDGHFQQVRTLQTHPMDMLAEQGITINAHDVLIVDGDLYAVDTLAQQSWDVPPMRVRLIRSVSVVVQDGDHTITLHTTALNVARALETAGLKLYLADRVTPALDTPLHDAMRITIERSIPLTVVADGRTLHTRARGHTVADALAMVGVVPLGLDYTVPPLDAPLEANMTVRIVRVTEQLVTQEETIPFPTLRSLDDLAVLANKRDMQGRIVGLRATVWCVRYEDGKETKREIWEESLTYPVSSHTIACGEQRP